MRPKKIEEGDWVLVYDISLDNQHKAMQKFARRWFGPYTVTSANDDTYHLTELEGTRLAIPMAGKQIKAFKRRFKGEPEPTSETDDDDRFGPGEESESDE